METNEAYSGDIMPGDTKLNVQPPSNQPQPTYQAPPQDMQTALQQQKNVGIHPIFSNKIQQNMLKTNEAGRPVYDEIDWVKIIVAGDRNNIIERKASTEDKQRWPAQYASFKAGERVSIEGTPIEEWPAIPRTMAETLKHFNIFNVEALAGLSDAGIQAVGMGARELVEKAKAYLEYAKDTALPQKLSADNLRLQDQIEALTQQMGEISQSAMAGQTLQKELDAMTSRAETAELRTQTLDAKIGELNARNELLESNNQLLKVENAKLDPKNAPKTSVKKKPKTE